MKKRHLNNHLRNLVTASAIFLFIFYFSGVGQAAAEKAKNEVTVFVVDTSASMVEENALPINRVRSFMKEYIEKSGIGDRIAIITFDEDVTVQEEKEIEKKSDIKNLIKLLDEIKPVGKWTWIRYALDDLRQRIDELKSKYPEKKLVVYFLTDGKDDPPPRSGERRRTFKELLIEYFEEFEEENTYIYALFSDPSSLTSKERDEVAKRTSVIPQEIPSEGAIHRVIELEPYELNLGIVAKDASELKSEIIVAKLINTKDDVVKLSLISEDISPAPQIQQMQSFSLPKETTLFPDSFISKSEGQRMPFTLSFPKPLNIGQYQGFLKIESSAEAIPQKIKISFKVVRDARKKIFLSPSKFVLGKLDLTQGREEKKILKIKKLANTQGETIHLNSSLPGVDISPSAIQCDKEGEKKIVISLSPDLSAGIGKRLAEIEITSDNPEVIISPQKINVSFVVQGNYKNKNGGMVSKGRIIDKIKKVFLMGAVLIALWISWLSLLRNKSLWLRREDIQKNHEIRIKGWSKTHLGEIGLSDYYLRFHKLWLGIILENKNENKGRKIKYQKEFDCRLSDGKNVKVIFSDRSF